MPKQINFRPSALTLRQLEQLVAWWGTNKTDAIATAVDHAHREEEHRRDLVVDLTAPDGRPGGDASIDEVRVDKHGHVLYRMGHWREEPVIPGE